MPLTSCYSLDHYILLFILLSLFIKVWGREAELASQSVTHYLSTCMYIFKSLPLILLLISHIVSITYSVPPQFHLRDSREFFDSLAVMIREFIRRPDTPVRLTRVLPSSDYDDTRQLLLCATNREVQREDLSGPRVRTRDRENWCCVRRK